MDQRQLIVHFNDTSPFLSVNTCFLWSQLSHKGITVCNTDLAAALQPVNKVQIDDGPVGLSTVRWQTHVHLWEWTPCDVTKGTETSPRAGDTLGMFTLPFKFLFLTFQKHGGKQGLVYRNLKANQGSLVKKNLCHSTSQESEMNFWDPKAGQHGTLEYFGAGTSAYQDSI